MLDGPFRDAMLRDQKYLLSLDPDRLLRNFRVNVGLPSDAKPYGGWEAPNMRIARPQPSAIIFPRVADVCQHGRRASSSSAWITSSACSRSARAIRRRPVFTKVICPRFRNRSLTAWSRASRSGRRGIRCTKSWPACWTPTSIAATQQALEVLTNMANWVKFRVDHLSHEQMQRSLETEQGGMTEVLANLYAVTGNTNYLRLSAAFNHAARARPAGARRGPAERPARQHADSQNHRRRRANMNSPATRNF